MQWMSKIKGLIKLVTLPLLTPLTPLDRYNILWQYEGPTDSAVRRYWHSIHKMLHFDSNAMVSNWQSY